MSRKLRPDTFSKQVSHHFRTLTKLSPSEVTIRCFTGTLTRDCTAGFEEYPANLRGMTLHGPTPADSHVMLQSLWSIRDHTIKEARQIAEGLVNFYAEALNKGHPSHRWPTLRELASLYAELARVGGQPIQMMLPREQGRKLEFVYPRIEMTRHHYATTVMSHTDFDDQRTLAAKLKEDAVVDKRLRKHVLDRTTIDKVTWMVLQADENFRAQVELLLAHKEIEVGPFKIRNHHEHISLQQATWHEAASQWLEYNDGTLSVRDVQAPLSVIDGMAGARLDSVITGVPAIGGAIVAKASNPKSYVMQQRPRQQGARNDAPTLRLKLDNARMTLRKAGATWDGPNPTHQAIAESDGYVRTLTGPFATIDANANLEELVAMAQRLHLLPPDDIINQ